MNQAPPIVTPGLDPGAHSAARRRSMAWVAGSSPAMTIGIALLALTLLAACGKKGAPTPPGPSNEIVYPRAYPSR